MIPATWTDEELLDAFAGCDAVIAHDQSTEPVPLPEPLACQALAGRQRWIEQLSTVHPEDRARVVKGWWEAVGHPGELRRFHVRLRAGDGWCELELRILSLLHQPQVRATLLGWALGEPVRVEEADLVSASYRVPTWVYHELDPMAVIVRMQGAADRVFGRAPEELKGVPVMQVIHPDDHDTVTRLWVDVLSVPLATGVVRLRVLKPDGSASWIESTLTNRLHETGVVTVSSVEISDPLSGEGALRASREEFRSLAEEIPVAVFRADQRGRITFGNSRWLALVAACGPVEGVRDLVHSDERERFDGRWARLVGGAAGDTDTIEIRAGDGERVFSLHCRRVDTSGYEPSVIGLLTDVTDTAELRYRAERDPLTGLLNRGAFEQVLQEALAEAPSVVVAFIDLDGFKDCNDRFGHEVGDLVLRAVSERLVHSVRPGDAVGRHGGDELVVMLRDVHDVRDEEIVGRLESVLDVPVTWDGGSWIPGASVGVARARPGDTPTDLLRRADGVMYERKHRRRRR